MVRHPLWPWHAGAADRGTVGRRADERAALVGGGLRGAGRGPGHAWRAVIRPDTSAAR